MKTSRIASSALFLFFIGIICRKSFLFPYKSFVCMGKLFVFIVFFLLYASLVKTDVSWNDGSRFAALESVVERHTFAIDNSSFLNITKDRVFFNGHFYSDKAPGLVFLALPVYFVLHSLGVPLFSSAGIFSVNLVVSFFI